MVLPLFFVANFHDLEIASATFMRIFWGENDPKSDFEEKKCFFFHKTFFFEKNKMGLLNPRTLC